MTAPRVTAGEFEREYGFSRVHVNRAAKNGSLAVAEIGQVKGKDTNYYNLEDILAFACGTADRKSDRPRMERDLARLQKGESLQEPETPPDHPERGFYNPEDLDKLANTWIPEEARGKAGDVRAITQTIAAVHEADIKKVKASSDAGRLVDVLDVSELVETMLGPLAEAIASLPELDSRLSKDHQIPQTQVLRILQDVRAHMERAVESANKLILTEPQETMRVRAKERRKGRA